TACLPPKRHPQQRLLVVCNQEVSSPQNPEHRCPSTSFAPHPTKLISSARSTAFHPASPKPGCKSRVDPTATPIPIRAHKSLSTRARSPGSALLSETRHCKSSTRTSCC